ncbi:MAG: ankyrin repeat domain-containing protein [Alkalinema sp. CAN_BIN05]|nr:ankyrin repeat domain-containing protein [Alkalinema sp. CAN_BIN05]
MDAIEKKDIKVVKEIVGSQIDLEEDIGEGATILIHACGVGSIKTVRFLVALGANVNARSSADFPLSNAAIEGYKEVYDYLYPRTNPTLRIIVEEDLSCR